MGYVDDKEFVQRKCDTDWSDRISWKTALTWLNQFDDDARQYAVKMLKHFQFYSYGNVLHMLKVVHFTHLKDRLIEPFFSAGEGFFEDHDEVFRAELRNTLFVQMVPSDSPKSGQNIGYAYGLATDLPEESFTTLDRLQDRIGGHIKNIVLLDDFLGTGTQAFGYYQTHINPVLARWPNVRVYLAVCVAMAQGVQFLEGCTNVRVLASEVLPESSKAFSPDSKVFEELDLAEAERLITIYGSRLCAEHPLGYDDCQLLIGFVWCPPDNTVTTIWWPFYDKWQPLLARSRKDEL